MCSDCPPRAKWATVDSYHTLGKTAALLWYALEVTSVEERAAHDKRYKKVRKGPSKHSPAKSRRLVRQLLAEGQEVRFAHEYRFFRASMYEMPLELTPEELIADASKAVQHAQSTRKAHARAKGGHRGGKQREQDIRLALERLQKAMKPLRRRIQRLVYLPSSYPGEGLREASQAIQRERRKLWKMQGPPKGKPRKPRPRKRPRIPKTSSKQTVRIKEEVSALIASLEGGS